MTFRPITAVQYLEDDPPYDPPEIIHYPALLLADDMVAWKMDHTYESEIYIYIMPEPVAGLAEVDITPLSPITIELNDAGRNTDFKKLAMMTLPELGRVLK